MSSGTPAESIYFAYGSNMSTARLRGRVGSARVAGAAWLDGHRLSCGKLGRDGTGKATLVVEAGSRVWGALYLVETTVWPVLDRYEPGYTRVALSVTTVRDEVVTATAYTAPETADPPIPLASYKRILLAGAIEHGLPSDYLEALRRLPEAPDSEVPMTNAPGRDT